MKRLVMLMIVVPTLANALTLPAAGQWLVYPAPVHGGGPNNPKILLYRYAN